MADLSQAGNLRDIEEVARAGLRPTYRDYIAGGARDGITLRANESAFAQLRLLPRMLRGAGKPELDLTLFGSPASMPILVAPTAFHKLVHPDGELATVRAVAAARTVMIVAMAATVAVGEIAAAAREVGGGRAALWFQLYIQPDLELTEAIVRRATEAGCEALVVTVDSAARGVNERNLRNGFTDLPEGLACENMRDARGGAPGRVRDIVMSPEIGWSHIEWLRQITSLPILLKGLLHPEDVRAAVRYGVDGLVLSNHGGRQLDTVPSTIELLPEVVAAVAGRIPIILDGGVRRGTDVVKALALGASAVGIGRPVLWGLAAGGEAGVRQVLELLRDEYGHALTLCGAANARELTPDLVRGAPR